MKLTKRQLRKIIKEEKTKLLKENEELEQYQAGWNAGQSFGPGEEDLIMSILQYYFGAAARDLEEAGVYFKDVSQMTRYIKMAADEYQG